ncbi:hypothetical protein GCM10027026_05370 [Myroides odoratimimus subsp. xuanwuensis]
MVCDRGWLATVRAMSSNSDGPRDVAIADLATNLHVLLQDREETLSTAESLTGGLLASLLTDAPGASVVYLGGVVSYATELKERLLGVPQEIVDEHGVVSAECASAMADGARRITGSTYALATTGVAGPTKQEDKDVGTVFVAVAAPNGTTVDALTLDGDRHAIREGTCAAALSALSAMLLEAATD